MAHTVNGDGYGSYDYDHTTKDYLLEDLVHCLVTNGADMHLWGESLASEDATAAANLVVEVAEVVKDRT